MKPRRIIWTRDGQEINRTELTVKDGYYIGTDVAEGDITRLAEIAEMANNYEAPRDRANGIKIEMD